MNSHPYLTIFLLVLTLAIPSVYSEEIDWDSVIIIDVRSRAEWNDSRLEGSIWIPWAQIEHGINQHQLLVDQTLAFYCAAGIRADRAIRRLKRLGFEGTVNLISLTKASEITGRKILK